MGVAGGGHSRRPHFGSQEAQEEWPRGGVCSAASRAPPRGSPSSPTHPVTPGCSWPVCGRNREKPQPEPLPALQPPAGVGTNATTQRTGPRRPQEQRRHPPPCLLQSGSTETFLARPARRQGSWVWARVCRQAEAGPAAVRLQKRGLTLLGGWSLGRNLPDTHEHLPSGLWAQTKVCL